MSKNPMEDVELCQFLKNEYVAIAEILRKKEKMTIPQIRNFMQEILDVTI